MRRINPSFQSAYRVNDAMSAQQLGQQPTHGSYQLTFSYSRIDNIPVRDLIAGVNLPPRKSLNMNQVNVDKAFLDRLTPPIGVIRTWDNQECRNLDLI